MPPRTQARQTVEVSPVPVRAADNGGGGGGSFGDKVKQHPVMSGTVLAVAVGVSFLIYKKVKGGSTSTSSTAASTPTASNSTTSQPYYSGSRHHHFNQGSVSSSNGSGSTVVGSANIGSGSSGGTTGSPNGQWVPPVVGAYTSGAQTTNVTPSGTASGAATPQPTQGITQQAWTVPTPYASDTVSNPQQNGLSSMTSNGSATTLPAPANSTAQLPANPGQGEPSTNGSQPQTTPQTRQSQRASILASRRVNT